MTATRSAPRLRDLPGVRVKSEPRTYQLDSPHSFFRDLATQTLAPYATNDGGASERLARHGQEVRSEIDRRSPEGLRAVAELRESTRTADASRHREHFEQRAGSTSQSSLGAFVTPQFVIEQWAAFAGINRVFANQTLLLPLPEFGLTVHVPRFTAAASAGAQAGGENSALANQDPTGGDLSADLFTVAGEVTISQQVHDRGYRGGGAYDLVLGQQIKEQLDESGERYALQQVVQVATSVAASASTFSLQSFYGDVALARNSVNDTAGVRLRPTHVFTTSDLHSYVTRVFDTTNRPAVVPTHASAPTAGDADAGYTGLVLPGSLGWWTSDAIPASGSNTKIIVSRPDRVLFWEGEPTLRSFPETTGQNLSVRVQLYNYVACIPRIPGATAYVTSNAYPTSLA